MPRIIPGDPQAPRPWVISAGTLALKLKLSATSRRVRAGTPLAPTPSGWAACQGSQVPWAFSADYKQPGDEVTAWREIVVDMGRMIGVPGNRFKISDIGDDGGITFELDEHGPHAVLWDTYCLLSCLPPPVVIPVVVEDPSPEPPPDYQNHPVLEPPLSDRR